MSFSIYLFDLDDNPGLLFVQGSIYFVVLLFRPSFQDVHAGVDLVTKLSNSLIETVIKEASTHNENVVITPFGILSNLAMILEASTNKTRSELLQTLNISSSDIPTLRKGFKAYCELFTKYSNESEAAGSFNSAALSSSFKLNSTYKDVLRKYYCANVTETLTGNETTLELSSIAGIMSHWKDYEKLAVYTFLSHQSLTPFRTRDGKTYPVPMIPQVGVFKTRRWENSQVILLPLQAKLVHLLLVIPDKPEDIDILPRKVRANSIPVIVQSLGKEELEVFIPQMTIVNKKFDLTSLLIRSGIRRAFDESKSELTKASTDEDAEVVLKKVEQNAFFSTSFNSLNSVAGLSSTSELHRRSKRDTRKFYVDRPFLFYVLQKDTQLSLLAGKVENAPQVPA